MLRATLEWRVAYRPDSLAWSDVASEAATGKLFVSPHPDREGRPVVVMRPRHENTRDREGQLRLLVYVLEAASRRADAAVAREVAAAAKAAGTTAASAAPAAAAAEASADVPAAPGGGPDGKLSIFIDFDGYSLFNAPPPRTALATLHILQGHYPERLGRSVLWRAPPLFSASYRALGPLIDPVTRAKLAFAARAEEVAAFFDPATVEACCGGLLEAPLFERGAYGAAMEREAQQAAAALAVAAAAALATSGPPPAPLSESEASAASLVALAASVPA